MLCLFGKAYRFCVRFTYLYFKFTSLSKIHQRAFSHELRYAYIRRYHKHTCICDPDMHSLQKSPLSLRRIVFSMFALYPLSVFRISPAGGISVQTLFSACNSVRNVINCLCHYSKKSLRFSSLQIVSSTLSIPQEDFSCILKIFISAALSGRLFRLSENTPPVGFSDGRGIVTCESAQNASVISLQA